MSGQFLSITNKANLITADVLDRFEIIDMEGTLATIISELMAEELSKEFDLTVPVSEDLDTNLKLYYALKRVYLHDKFLEVYKLVAKEMGVEPSIKVTVDGDMFFKVMTHAPSICSVYISSHLPGLEGTQMTWEEIVREVVRAGLIEQDELIGSTMTQPTPI